MKIVNLTRNVCLAKSVIMADSFFTRLRGLLGRPGLDPGCCLALKPCRSVHTMFMRFPIDVLFVDSRGRAVGAAASLAPFRATRVVRQALMALELPAGTLAATGTSAGDIIKITEG